MKLLYFFLFSVLFFLSNITYSQQIDKTFFFKDTIFEYSGLKLEVKKSLANSKMFKAAFVITNNSDQFVIINSENIIGSEPNSTVKITATTSKKIVVPPKSTKGFTIRFPDIDLRKPELEINVESIQLTDKVESVYEISDFDFYNETSKTVGPIKWTVFKIVQDENDKNDNFRIDGTIEYTGNKFLAIFHNNIVMKTKDGQTFINSGPSRSPLLPNRNKFYYDNAKVSEKQVLVFPVESDKIKRTMEPKLNFTEVFKEYSLITIPGFKIKLKHVSFENYKGSDKKDNDIDIENMD